MVFSNNQRNSTKKRPVRLFSGFLAGLSLAVFLIQLRITYPEVAPPLVCWVFLHQLVIQKVPPCPIYWQADLMEVSSH